MCVSVRFCAYMCHMRGPLVFVSVRLWHGVLQGHVLGPGERQPVCAVVVHQLGDAGEDAAALVQRVAQALAALGLSNDDVDTALTGLQSDGVLAGS